MTWFQLWFDLCSVAVPILLAQLGAILRYSTNVARRKLAHHILDTTKCL